MNVIENLAKSSLMALVIFWVIIRCKSFEVEALPYVMLSFIPIFICVAIVIVGSICPFFWAATNNKFTHKEVFTMCFPYYSCIAFGLCCYGIITSNFDLHFTAFCTSAFSTTNQSWVWFAKTDKKMHNNKLNNTTKTTNNLKEAITKTQSM
nr:hypothetical protein [uncultured Psychroserpens sp.]